MRINAEFITSVGRPEQLPDENLPEIALTGRSNVGKSSLINALLGQPGLARTSNTPGRTQTLNYYHVTPDAKTAFYLVDMPGYGHAAANLGSRAQWSHLVERYLKTRPTLRSVMMLIDLRLEPQPLDHVMSRWLTENGHRYAVVGTKADKLPKSKVSVALKQAAKSLDLQVSDMMAFSAQTGLGRDQLWHWVVNATQAPPRV